MPNTKTGLFLPLSLVFLFALILFPLLEELGVEDFREGCNEHIKARRQIVAQRTPSKRALISFVENIETAKAQRGKTQPCLLLFLPPCFCLLVVSGLCFFGGKVKGVESSQGATLFLFW